MIDLNQLRIIVVENINLEETNNRNDMIVVFMEDEIVIVFDRNKYTISIDKCFKHGTLFKFMELGNVPVVVGTVDRDMEIGGTEIFINYAKRSVSQIEYGMIVERRVIPPDITNFYATVGKLH